MSDLLLARLTYEPPRPVVKAIPWPDGFAPAPYAPRPNDVLPQTDVIALCWTAAEAMAMADVLTPGVHHTDWTPYAVNWDAYEHQLTDRSPARDEHCLAHFCRTNIGGVETLVIKLELHLATDAKSLPLRQLLGQLIRGAQPRLVIDSGTSGGVGPDVAVGDTVVAENLRFDCLGFLKDEPYAQQSFACTYSASKVLADFESWPCPVAPLIAVNADLLAPQTTRPLKQWTGDVLTCDEFAFDDAEDTYGLETYDKGAALAEEMDASVLGLVAEDLGDAMPLYCSLRSVSDPQVSRQATIEDEKRSASQIYEQFGYAAQFATAIAVWGVIVAQREP